MRPTIKNDYVSNGRRRHYSSGRLAVVAGVPQTVSFNGNTGLKIQEDEVFIAKNLIVASSAASSAATVYGLIVKITDTKTGVSFHQEFSNGFGSTIQVDLAGLEISNTTEMQFINSSGSGTIYAWVSINGRLFERY